MLQFMTYYTGLRTKACRPCVWKLHQPRIDGTVGCEKVIRTIYERRADGTGAVKASEVVVMDMEDWVVHGRLAKMQLYTRESK